MDASMIQANIFWSLMLIISSMFTGTYSDMGKLSSSQNHFGNSPQSHFTTKNSTRVIAQKGGLAILPCVVKLNSPATVSWIRRSDFQLLTVGLSTHSSDKRFLVEHTRHMGHWSLRIKSVRYEDRGLYECQLSIYPTQSIFVELKVVEAMAEIVGAPDLHIDEGSTLRLECRLKRATENPAFVFWYHDSKMVNYDSQDGFYVTSGTTNSTQTPEGETTTIGVKNASLNKSRGNNSTKKSVSALNNISNKHSSGQQSPSTPAAIPQSHQTSYLLSPTSSILTLREVHFHHAGNYTCAPSNARPASITVHVLRGEKPAAMQHANRSLIESDASIGLNSTNSANHGNSVHNDGLIPRYMKFLHTKKYIQICHGEKPSMWVLSAVTLSFVYYKIKR